MKRILIFFVSAVLVAACKNKKAEEPAATEKAPARTPVTIALPTDTIILNDEVNLTAMATYLLKSDVKANANGYITKMTIKVADWIRHGQLLFSLQTKEARALGNTINQLDPSFRFNGSTTILSPATGYVEVVNHQQGDYVQDGEVLATITDANSFGFVMNVPYEYNQLIRLNKSFIVTLPDGRNINGYVAKIMPSLDSVSQTQKVLVKVHDAGKIPENLIATIRLAKSKDSMGLVVPKPAVLSDETQSAFWVMKLINDTTAVKTAIEKGTETDKWVQIKSGNLNVHDRIVVTGNFGLSDTAYVSIQK